MGPAIGLYGGTFNPIHNGHLRSAVEVGEAFGLDPVYLIPSATPPHKPRAGIVEAAHRLEMTRLGAGRAPGLSVSDVELRRSGPSYSVDTIAHFRSSVPEGRIYFIVGRDAFMEIDTWNRNSELFDLAPMIVISRPSPEAPDGGIDPGTLGRYLRQTISDAYDWSASDACFHHPEKQPIHIARVSLMEISSTDVRRRARDGRSIRFLVPGRVADYIEAEGLYR